MGDLGEVLDYLAFLRVDPLSAKRPTGSSGRLLGKSRNLLMSLAKRHAKTKILGPS